MRESTNGAGEDRCASLVGRERNEFIGAGKADAEKTVGIVTRSAALKRNLVLVLDIREGTLKARCHPIQIL